MLRSSSSYLRYTVTSSDMQALRSQVPFAILYDPVPLEQNERPVVLSEVSLALLFLEEIRPPIPSRAPQEMQGRMKV